MKQAGLSWSQICLKRLGQMLAGCRTDPQDSGQGSKKHLKLLAQED